MTSLVNKMSMSGNNDGNKYNTRVPGSIYLPSVGFPFAPTQSPRLLKRSEGINAAASQTEVLACLRSPIRPSLSLFMT